MVTGVNNAALAALRAQESALANRAPTDSQTPAAATPPDRVQDPAVVYAGAPGAPDVSALLSVQQGLSRAASISDVALSAGRTISDLLTLMKDKAASAKDADAAQRQGLDGDYQQLLKTVDQIARSASFQGSKLLDGGSGELSFKADADGGAVVTLTPQDFTVGGPVISLEGTSLNGPSDQVAGVLSQVDAASGRVDRQLSKLSGQAELIQGHLGVLSQLQTSLTGAEATDHDAETARLQALQLAQGLSEQGAAVANSAPQALLALFRD